MSAKIAIITVTLNAEKLLISTINSVVKQTLKNFEYIIVDGGSTDNTLSVIKRYADCDTRVRFISEKDNGIFDAMNKGLALASADYVLFLNAGDVFASDDILKKIFNREGDFDLYYGRVNLINESGNVLKIPTVPKKLNMKKILKGWGAIPVCHQAFIPKRILCHPYDLKFKYHSDFDWMIKIVKKAKNIINVNLEISNYLIGGYSLKHTRQVWKDRLLIVKSNYGLKELFLLYCKCNIVKIVESIIKPNFLK